MFTIPEILDATQGVLLQGPGRGRVRCVGIDSRTVKKGELFIAVKGEVFDGHDFIDDVIAKGVRVLVVHKPVAIKNPKVTMILVRDTIRALGDIARFHRMRFKVPVITLTGSAGKTTTKDMIAAVLSRRYKVLKNEGTQNNHIGVPLTLLKIKAKHQIVILECGTNQPGDILWLADVARPGVAVFTNIGESHLEKLKTVGGVLKEKWALTSFMGPKDTVIINADDVSLYGQSHQKHIFKIISYGIKANVKWRAGDIYISPLPNPPHKGEGKHANSPHKGEGKHANSPYKGEGKHANPLYKGEGKHANPLYKGEGKHANPPHKGEGNRIHFSVKSGRSGLDRKMFELNSCGVNNVYNALAAVSCGAIFKVPFKDMALALKAFDLPQGRGQIVRLGTGWLINDTYNANPVSMRSALQMLKVIETQRKRIFVAADMLELGNQSRALHQSMGPAIAAAGVDVLITVGHFARLMALSAKRHLKEMQVFTCTDVQTAQKYLGEVFQNGDAVLVKGSRRMRMEQVAEFLLAAPG